MKFYSIIKRALDLIFSVIGIIIALPFLLFAFLILYFELKKFPLFIQERGLTLRKYRFKIFKLRTLKENSSETVEHSSVYDIFIKPAFSYEVTPFAAWLRRNGLDELPQLFNVLFGQMSFIGPRPLMIQDLKILKKEFPTQYRERESMSAKPGITGMWQIFGDREQGVDNLIGLDFVYDRYRSFYLDYKLFIATIPLVLGGKNSDAILFKGSSGQRNSRSLFSISSKFKLDFHPFSTNFFAVDSSSNQKHYSVEIPNDWWYVSDTYKVLRTSESSLKIVKLNDKNKKADSA
jgi:lipopolysaccharide/colanic/teichoic acid biosynthesis glycosyltransferase